MLSPVAIKAVCFVFLYHSSVYNPPQPFTLYAPFLPSLPLAGFDAQKVPQHGKTTKKYFLRVIAPLNMNCSKTPSFCRQRRRHANPRIQNLIFKIFGRDSVFINTPRCSKNVRD